MLSAGKAMADVDALIRQGDKAEELKQYPKMEKIFTQAMKEDPDSPRILFALARAKSAQSKYAEAKVLLDKVLAMPVSNGRDVFVFYPGKKSGEEAELVDEIVLPPQRTKSNMRNYLDIRGDAPIPQYRLFFKKKQQMQLVPQSVVRLKYKGVLRSTFMYVKELSDQVERHLISAGATGNIGDMVSIPGGCFQMGSTKGSHDEEPVHEVCLKAFKLDKYEVTQAQFQHKFGDNPSQYVGADLPVDSATWPEAELYCREQGKRLPTEAEQEYALRGGTTSTFYWGDKVKGNESNFCDKNCQLNIRVGVDDGYKTTAPVGKFPPNPYGLYDIAGNLAEWSNDWMDEDYYRKSPKDNPPGGTPSRLKIVRGGAWNTGARFLRSSARAAYTWDVRNPGVGFRCAK